MKKCFFPPAKFKRWCSITLAMALVIAACFVLPATVSAEENATTTANDGQVMAIKLGDVKDAAFGQTVWLKPDTEYTFSYKYSHWAADVERLLYYTSAAAGTQYSTVSTAYDGTYNMKTIKFKTVTADTAGVIVENGLIKSFIGIDFYQEQTNSVWGTKKIYKNNEVVYGDFILNEGSNTENLFADLLISSMQTATNDTAVWGNEDRTNQWQIAAQRFSRYQIDGKYPTVEFFRAAPMDSAVKFKKSFAYSRPFAQTVTFEAGTEYIFSYYHSGTPANSIALENKSNTEVTAQMSADITNEYGKYNRTYKKITIGSATANYNTVTADIGITYWANNTTMLNQYYGGFTLYKASDPNRTNLLKDPKLLDIDKTASKTASWHTLGWAKTTDFYEKQSGLSDSVFKAKYNMSVGTTTNGTVTASAVSGVVYGDNVTFNVTPNAGYRLLELTANGKTIPCIDGAYTLEMSDKYSNGTNTVNIATKFCKENETPAIYVKKLRDFDTNFTQLVYLEPETEYVFSYKYSNLPVSGAVFCAYDKAGFYDVSNKIVDEEYKMETFTFKTFAADHSGLTFGTGGDYGLIASNIGIRINNGASHEYLNNCLFADFTLYKKDDPYKTNLFTALDYSGIKFYNDGNWRDLYKDNQISNNYEQYDANATIDGIQYPSIDLFKNTTKNITIDSSANTNGAVNVSANANIGDTVTVTAVPNEGYWTKGVSINVDGSKTTKINDNTFTFVMPDVDVKVYANFKAVFSGDVNDDDVINIIDLVRIKKHSADNAVEVIKANADTNGDSTVNAEDIASVRTTILLATTSIKELDTTDTLNNTYYKLNKEEELTVTYFGGSVTQGWQASDLEAYSYRALTTEWLRKTYPNAAITMTNAAISGTGSKIGAHRAVTDLMLKTNAPDLLFIEFAINDVYADITTDETKANLESIINTVYSYSPNTDIVFLFTTDLTRVGQEFDIIKAQKEIAAAYNIPWIDIGAELSKVIIQENGNTAPTTQNEVWSKYVYDTVHPTDAGHKIYADTVIEYLDGVLTKASAPAKIEASYQPETTVCTTYVNPTAVNFKGQTAPANFTVDENGYLTGNTADSSFTFTFKGTELGFWAYGLTNGGDAEFVIDNGEAIKVSAYRNAGYIEKTVATGLENKEHTVTVTLKTSEHGSGIDIRYFLINGAADSNGVNLVTATEN